MEFGTRIIHIADKSIKLQIWDTAGQVNKNRPTTQNKKGGFRKLKKNPSRNDLGH